MSCDFALTEDIHLNHKPHSPENSKPCYKNGTKEVLHGRTSLYNYYTYTPQPVCRACSLMFNPTLAVHFKIVRSTVFIINILGPFHKLSVADLSV